MNFIHCFFCSLFMFFHNCSSFNLFSLSNQLILIVFPSNVLNSTIKSYILSPITSYYLMLIVYLPFAKLCFHLLKLQPFVITLYFLLLVLSKIYHFLWLVPP